MSWEQRAVKAGQPAATGGKLSSWEQRAVGVGGKPIAPQKQEFGDLQTGVPMGMLKGAGSTLESGVRSLGQIGGGITAGYSVPIQERRQANLTTQYEQALQNKNPELARQIQGQIQGAGKVTRGAEWAFDNPFLAKVREELKPKTTAEKIGYGAEKIAEFFTPGGMVKQATKGTGILGRALGQGASAGTIKLAQTGAGTTGERKETYESLRESLKTGVIAGAVSAGTELLAKGISAGLEKLGSKIQFASVKPREVDVKDGFKVENIKKYKVGGTLNQSLQKTNDRLNEYRTQLQGIIKKSDAKVDLNKVLGEVDDVIASSQTKNFGSNKQIRQAYSEMYDELVGIANNKPKIDLLTAQDLKIGAGTQGAWQFGKPDADSAAKEKVYNIFYNAIKKNIESSVGTGQVQVLNKAMSELIPIKNALIRRIPVASRNNPIGLLEGISLIQTLTTGNMAGLAFLGAKGVTGSAKAGAMMRDVAPIIGKTEQASGLLSKFISGLR